MVKIWRCGLMLVAGFWVFSAVPGCFGSETDSLGLVSPELLKAGGFETVWQTRLPIKKGESLERLFILGQRIYALSDHNYMVSLSRQNGNIIFGTSFAEAGFSVMGLALYQDRLLSVIGNKVVEIDPDSGVQQNTTRLDLGIVCPVARNSSCFYIAGSDRRVHTLRAEDKVALFEVAAEDESMITSIVADDGIVVFGTNTGTCIGITPEAPKRLWQFDAADGIVGPMVRSADALFFASRDTNVYKLDIATGQLVWKCQTAALLEDSPRVTAERVYQYVRGSGLTAIDSESGQPVWQLAKGVELLAEAGGNSYVITKAGKLVVMDNNTAKQVYSVNFAKVSRYVANLTDSLIYIADENGRIACLKPIE